MVEPNAKGSPAASGRPLHPQLGCGLRPRAVAPRQIVAQTFLSAGSGDFPVTSFTPRAKHGTRKFREPAGWKACATRERLHRNLNLGRTKSKRIASPVGAASLSAIGLRSAAPGCRSETDCSADIPVCGFGRLSSRQIHGTNRNTELESSVNPQARKPALRGALGSMQRRRLWPVSSVPQLMQISATGHGAFELPFQAFDFGSCCSADIPVCGFW